MQVNRQKNVATNKAIEQSSKQIIFPFEKILFGYFATLSLFIIVFSKGSIAYYFYLFVNVFFVGLILFVKKQSEIQPSTFWKLLRYWLPIFLFTFMYEEAGKLIHLINKGWIDPLLVQIDQTIFGVNLGLWVEKFDHPLLNEIFRIGYGSYYFIIIIGAAILYFKDERREYVRMLSAVTLAFCLSYLMFIIFPAQGPRFYLADRLHTNMDGLWFSWLQQKIIEIGSFRGGAFPSSHIAVAIIVWLSLFKKHRTAFIVFTPFVITLILGTVYARYHYTIDGIAGIALAVAIFYLFSSNVNTATSNLYLGNRLDKHNPVKSRYSL